MSRTVKTYTIKNNLVDITEFIAFKEFRLLKTCFNETIYLYFFIWFLYSDLKNVINKIKQNFVIWIRHVTENNYITGKKSNKWKVWREINFNFLSFNIFFLFFIKIDLHIHS